jgi:mannitol-1-phosphate 5-dehydrogenase
MRKTAVIFGAGKIARGFIAHLLTLSGYHITFTEKSPGLVTLLRERKKYAVHIMGAEEKSIVIEGFDVLSSDETEAVANKVAGASVVFVSIGGPNLPQIAPLLAMGVRFAIVRKRKNPLNVIICENYFQPGKWLLQLVSDKLTPPEKDWLNRHVGFVETMVLRSTIEPTPEMKAEDPLCLKAQNMWEMPADKNAFAGEIPPIQGLAPRENFQGALTRKLFTYNAINASIAYPGYLRGYELLSEAANDPELAELARTAGREASEALIRRFGFDPEEQYAFAEAALKKYQNPEIVDPIERNARDPVRKLGRNDRLVGPACLALEYRIQPAALSQVIGAALHYDYTGDSAAQRLQRLIQEKGLAAALNEVSGIESSHALVPMIEVAYGKLGKKR